jgi:hypothetical protein
MIAVQKTSKSKKYLHKIYICFIKLSHSRSIKTTIFAGAKT